MADFSVPIVRIGTISKHQNADTLSITEIDGCPVVIRTGDFKEGDMAVYLPIESMIPEGRQWVSVYCSHLKFKSGFHRLKALRLRGVFSMGMLVPVNALFGMFSQTPILESGRPLFEPSAGEDVAVDLGVTKYEEPEEVVHLQSPQKRRPWWRVAWLFLLRNILHIKPRPQKPRLIPVYDVEHYRRCKGVLQLGEEVIVTEKIHGQNFAACYHNGGLVVSSHRMQRPQEDDSNWWRVARQYDLRTKLESLPGLAFFGEIYGAGVQDMEYDVLPGTLRLVIFDILTIATREFLGYDERQQLCSVLGLPTVPLLYRGPYIPDFVESLSDGPSAIASHFREGIVILPAQERRNPHCGRVILKLVGETYLLRKLPTEKH